MCWNEGKINFPILFFELSWKFIENWDDFSTKITINRKIKISKIWNLIFLKDAQWAETNSADSGSVLVNDLQTSSPSKRADGKISLAYVSDDFQRWKKKFKGIFFLNLRKIIRKKNVDDKIFRQIFFFENFFLTFFRNIFYLFFYRLKIVWDVCWKKYLTIGCFWGGSLQIVL